MLGFQFEQPDCVINLQYRHLFFAENSPENQVDQEAGDNRDEGTDNKKDSDQGGIPANPLCESATDSRDHLLVS